MPGEALHRTISWWSSTSFSGIFRAGPIERRWSLIDRKSSFGRVQALLGGDFVIYRVVDSKREPSVLRARGSGSGLRFKLARHSRNLDHGIAYLNKTNRQIVCVSA